MQATSVQAQSEAPTRPPTAQLAAGDRIFLIGRLLIAMSLFIITIIQQGIAPFPVALDSEPLLLVLYAYVAVLLISSVLALVPALRGILGALAFIDIIFIAAAALLAPPPPPAVLFGLFFLPVTYLGIRNGTGTGIVAGIMAVLLYGVALFAGPLVQQTNEFSVGIADGLLLVVQGSLLIFIPWLVNVLKEAWGDNNTAKVLVANEQVAAAQREIETYRSRNQILFSIAKNLSDTMSGAKILDGMLDNAYKLVPYDAGMALLPTGGPAEVRVDAGYGLSIVDRGMTLIAEPKGMLATAFSNQPRTLFVENISTEPSLQNLNTPRNCQAAVIVPMHNGFEVYGLVVCMRNEAQPFTEDEAHMIEALSIYATSALMNATLAEDLKQLRVNVSNAQERARHDLAREIHDGLAQKLAAITMNIDFIKRMVQTNPPAAIKEMDRIGEMFRRANYDVRTLLGELKPTTLEQRGLPSATEELLERYRKQYPDMTFSYKAKNVSGLTLAPHDKSTLYNIIQESINNAIKHAEASQIEVRFEREGYRLSIAIQDNGKGFDVDEAREKARARGSHGLSNLNDRASQVMVGDKAGTAQIHSAPGKGTTVLVNIPLEV